jgi:hypothetical protein
MWPDDTYWVEVRNIPLRRSDWQMSWRRGVGLTPEWEAGPF